MPTLEFEITEMRSQTALDDHNRPYDAVRIFFRTRSGDVMALDVPQRGFSAEIAKQRVAQFVAELNKVRA